MKVTLYRYDFTHSFEMTIDLEALCNAAVEKYDKNTGLISKDIRGIKHIQLSELKS